jgi:hypothetical protein
MMEEKNVKNLDDSRENQYQFLTNKGRNSKIKESFRKESEEYD